MLNPVQSWFFHTFTFQYLWDRWPTPKPWGKITFQLPISEVTERLGGYKVKYDCNSHQNTISYPIKPPLLVIFSWSKALLSPAYINQAASAASLRHGYETMSDGLGRSIDWNDNFFAFQHEDAGRERPPPDRKDWNVLFCSLNMSQPCIFLGCPIIHMYINIYILYIYIVYICIYIYIYI